MNLIKIKDDLYVPEDFETNHKYFADAEGTKPYTGITTILNVIAKPNLIQWAANEAVKYVRESLKVVDVVEGELRFGYEFIEKTLEEARTAHARKKEKAGTHGTDAHALVETYVKLSIEAHGGKPALTAPESIAKFQEWAIANVDQFLFSERRLSNKDLFVAGTADFAYVKDGKRYMADFKTSSGVYGIDYFLQCAAYRFLAESEGDEPYDGTTIVRLGKDGSFDVHHRFDYETDLKAFMACLTLYRAQQTYKK